jgi:hypothetical protein
MKNTIGARVAGDADKWDNYQTWRVWVDVITDLDAGTLRNELRGLEIEEAGRVLERYARAQIWPDGYESHSTIVRSWAAAFLIPVEWEAMAAVVMDAVNVEAVQ